MQSMPSILKSFAAVALVCALMACGQKGPLCMKKPNDGSTLPAHVPQCPT